MGKSYQAPVVGKAFAILEVLSRRDEGLTVSELAAAAGLGKSTALGILAALEVVRAVERDPATRRYVLGLGLFELGRAVDARLDLKDVARPILGRLMDQSRQSVFLGVRAGDHVTVLDVVESREDLKVSAPVGTRLPLLAGATGKALLACLPEAEALALVRKKGLRRFTARSITEPERYMEALAEVRRNGYALDDEEYLEGVRAVAAPILGGGSRAAAIWVVGFTSGMDGDRFATVARETRLAAEAVGAKLRP
ncbi:MAG: IclR family transcriptional regulator [Deltaproteobacteria bacterium]|nr:IclR family transcriptional regulator [Deltaproteobacteria bacterium]